MAIERENRKRKPRLRHCLCWWWKQCSRNFYHFVDEPSVKIIAAEAGGFGVNSGKSAATTFLGTTGVLHGSKSIVMQTNDGQGSNRTLFLRVDYPGIGPFHANLFKNNRAEFSALMMTKR